MRLQAHFQSLRKIAAYNVNTLRDNPLQELGGALGDLGTLLPLMIALSVKNAIDLPSTLVFSGLTNIFTGAAYGVPLPVQPMKAIAAVAISQNFTQQQTAAAGITVALAVLFLSITGLLKWLHRVVPIAVVKGIQVGAGLSLAISAGTTLIKPLGWAQPASDNRIWAIAAFLLLIFAALFKRFPYALLVFILGLTISAASISSTSTHPAGIWHPSAFIPSASAWRTGALEAALPQLPLTTLNSILAVTSLSASLFPSGFPPAPSTTSLGLSVATANLIACWFGAMPICHGSGGLAGQYRFGARSGSSIIILGLVKLILGLFVGEAIVPLLTSFPKSLLGIMVLAAGVELAKVGQSVNDVSDLWDQAEEEHDEDSRPEVTDKRRQIAEQEGRDRWMVMLVTAAGCLAFKNDLVGFLAGMLWYWGLKAPQWWAKMRPGGTGAIRLRHEARAEEGESLLISNHDAPEGRID